jgi:hypothetical protein
MMLPSPARAVVKTLPKVDSNCTKPSLIPTVNGNTVRSFSTHGQQSAAQGSSTTVSHALTRPSAALAHLDGDGRLHAVGDAHALQRRLQTETVHHRRQHPHIVGSSAVEACSLMLRPPEEVTAPHHNRHLSRGGVAAGSERLSWPLADARCSSRFAARARFVREGPDCLSPGT